MSLHSTALILVCLSLLGNVKGVWDRDLALYECDNQPCDCDEINLNCISTTFHSNGCNQCLNGYFKYDYNYKCVNCNQVFGDECLFCQDFNGCGQCKQGYHRIKDDLTGLWYCHSTTGVDGITVTPLEIISPQIGQVIEYDWLSQEYDQVSGPSQESTDNIILEGGNKMYKLDAQTGELFLIEFDISIINEIFSTVDDVVVDVGGCINCDTTENDQLGDDCIPDGAGDPIPTQTIITRRRLNGIQFIEGVEMDGNPINFSPEKHIGQLGLGGGCSGTLINDRWVLTAGHCIHPGSGSHDDWVGNLVFYPRQTESYITLDKPYNVIECWTWTKWFEDGNSTDIIEVNRAFEWDMAWVKLESSILNENLGYAEMATDTQLSWVTDNGNLNIRSLGYPAIHGFGQMYYSQNFDGLYYVDDYKLQSNNIYLIGGMSGGPLYARYGTNNTPYIHGVNSRCWEIPIIGSDDVDLVNQYCRLSKYRKSVINAIIDGTYQ